jgi:hypothetical protein
MYKYSRTYNQNSIFIVINLYEKLNKRKYGYKDTKDSVKIRETSANKISEKEDKID